MVSMTMHWRRQVSWQASDLGWRIAVLFMVGSFLFALGSFPPYSQLVYPGIVGITFVVGSLFFTSASYSQFLQAINSGDNGTLNSGRLRFWAWQPKRMVWWANAVQSVGTLFFNLNTIDSMLEGLSTKETHRLVWAPDFFGCIAFLIASHLAWLLVCRRVWCVHRDDPDWWIAMFNYVGSIFFMISAIASFTLTTTDTVVNLTLVNLGTFVGAVCFFVGAYLLLPPAASSVES